MLATPTFPVIDDMWEGVVQDPLECDTGSGHGPVWQLPALLNDELCAALVSHPALDWKDRQDVDGSQSAGFFAPSLAKALQARLAPVLSRLPDDTFGYGFVRAAAGTRRINPCFRLTRYGASTHFGLHRDLPATFPDGLSDHSLLLHVGGRVEDSTTRFLLHSHRPTLHPGSGAGLSVEEELSQDDRADDPPLDVSGQHTLLFSQRLLHGGTRAYGHGVVKVMLRTDVVCDGVLAASSPIHEARDSEQVAKTLFRNAQIAELAGTAPAAATEMYQRSTHLRLAAQFGVWNVVAPARWLADNAMCVTANAGESACVARSGCRYLFYHGRGMVRDEAVLAAAARYVLACMLQAVSPALVFDGVPLAGDEWYWVGGPKLPNGFQADMRPAAKDCIQGQAPATAFSMGTWECDLVRKVKEYERCYCGCDKAGRLPSPKVSKELKRDVKHARVHMPAIPDTSTVPLDIEWDDSRSSTDALVGTVTFDIAAADTFHHAACTGGWRVTERRVEGTDTRDVKVSFDFVLGATLLLVKVRVYVLM